MRGADNDSREKVQKARKKTANGHEWGPRMENQPQMGQPSRKAIVAGGCRFTRMDSGAEKSAA